MDRCSLGRGLERRSSCTALWMSSCHGRSLGANSNWETQGGLGAEMTALQLSRHCACQCEKSKTCDDVFFGSFVVNAIQIPMPK